jgi:hypothetical protein
MSECYMKAAMMQEIIRVIILYFLIVKLQQSSNINSLQYYPSYTKLDTMNTASKTNNTLRYANIPSNKIDSTTAYILYTQRCSNKRQ